MKHGYYDEAKGPTQDKEWSMVTMMKLSAKARQGMKHGYHDEAKGPTQDNEWGMVTMMKLRDQPKTRNEAWLLWWS